MTNYAGLRPRLAGLGDQLSDKFKASHHGFRLDITEEKRFSLKLKLCLSSKMFCDAHGSIRWRNTILGCLVLELTNLQDLQEKASTNTNYGLPSPLGVNIFRFEKDSAVSECKGEKRILWMYVTFHRSFTAKKKCA